MWSRQSAMSRHEWAELAGRARHTCGDKLALIRMVDNCLEEGVGKEAAAAREGGQVPDDAATIAAGRHKLIPATGFHQDGVHSSLVLLQANQLLSTRKIQGALSHPCVQCSCAPHCVPPPRPPPHPDPQPYVMTAYSEETSSVTVVGIHAAPSKG